MLQARDDERPDGVVIVGDDLTMPLRQQLVPLFGVSIPLFRIPWNHDADIFADGRPPHDQEIRVNKAGHYEILYSRRPREDGTGE